MCRDGWCVRDITTERNGNSIRADFTVDIIEND
jgi:hypothetical protein